MIDTPALSQRFLKQESRYGSLDGRRRVIRTYTHAGLAPGASGSAQQSARETQRISIMGTGPPICRGHVTFQGPLIPDNKNKNENGICSHHLPLNLHHNNFLHRATPNLLPPLNFHRLAPL